VGDLDVAGTARLGKLDRSERSVIKKRSEEMVHRGSTCLASIGLLGGSVTTTYKAPCPNK
jgi:hypothetical protein